MLGKYLLRNLYSLSTQKTNKKYRNLRGYRKT